MPLKLTSMSDNEISAPQNRHFRRCLHVRTRTNMKDASVCGWPAVALGAVFNNKNNGKEDF